MEISKQINDLLEKYSCTAKELANASHLSVSVISRYRNGTRHPSEQQLKKLLQGFSVIAKQRGEVFDFHSTDLADNPKTDMDMFVRKFNILISTLDINMNDFARFSNYDPSFISRIRSKQRTISDMDSFAEKIGEFLNAKYRNEEYDHMIETLMGNPDMTQNSAKYISSVREWFLSEKPAAQDRMILAERLHDIDLQKHFEEIGFVPPELAVDDFSTIRSYSGKEQVCRGELDFLKYALAEKDIKELYLFSEMPHFIFRHEELADEWIYLLSCIIRKGVSVTIIHNVQRPFGEILSYIEKILPLYVTGCVRPYYLPTAKNTLYYHICGCTENTVMYGEGVYGHETHVKLHLDRTAESVDYYHKEMQVLLQKSHPLMNIYKKDDQTTFRQFIKADMCIGGERYGMLSMFPLFTIQKDLLLSILRRHNASDDEITAVLHAWEETQNNVSSMLQKGHIHEDIILLSKEDFDISPPPMTLSYAFTDRNMYYTYEEYQQHYQHTLAFAQQHPNYTVSFRQTSSPKHINIIMHKGKWIVVSKIGCPAIHFVVRHPNIRKAMESIIFSPPN